MIFHHFIKQSLPTAAVLLLSSTAMLMGQEPAKPDTSIIFTPSTRSYATESFSDAIEHAWGMDLMISTNGFGMGGFYRQQFSETLAGMLSFGVSDVKDAGENEFIDYYTGQSFVPGKKNRMLLLPLIASVQYRLFRNQIAENFRPYLEVGAGPTMIYVSPYIRATDVVLSDGSIYRSTEKVDFFESLSDGQPHYTIGGYLGGGAYFGRQRSSVMGLSIRYYFVPFPSGLEILEGALVRDFGGLYITLHFGSGY